MSFVASFIITPTADASTFVITDTSSGSDGSLTGRTISLFQSNGQLLVPPIAWNISDSTYTYTGLQQDIALNIVVNWNSSNPLPSPSTYTYSLLNAFVKYGQDFIYGLTQDQLADPTLAQDNDWYTNKLTVICLIESALNAISNGESIMNAQYMIALYQQYINNKNYYF